MFDEAPSADQPASPSRRRFLHTGLATLPVLTATTASAGIIAANSPARLPRIPLVFPELPEALRGLKLLHISDIHVGPYISLSDLEALVDRARSLQPDLVFVSGDICDHLPSYLDSLRILEQLRPTHGTYASLGNHKYFRGIEAVRSSFEKSDIPLLVDDGIALEIDGEKIFVSGADDPRHMGGPELTAKLRRSVEESQKKADGMGFRILMSHRSVAFDTAAELSLERRCQSFNFTLQHAQLFFGNGELAFPSRVFNAGGSRGGLVRRQHPLQGVSAVADDLAVGR